MASTSAAELARQLLAHCLEHDDYPEALANELIARAAVDEAAARAFFAITIERLGDLFEPRLCELYARLFSHAISYVEPELRQGELLARYERVRRPQRFTGDTLNVFVLSRITLGADVVVTSTLLDAAQRRFPHANIWFVGPRKNWSLFGANPRVDRLSLDYPRGGTLADRVSLWRKLESFFASSDGIVIDPDSRLTQLGLLPVCPEDRYFFFESRAYGGEGDEPLAKLTARWAGEVFGIADARPFVALPPAPGDYDVTVSLGVGENEEKRLGDGFECDLLRSLHPRRVTLDSGAGGAEAERVARAADGLSHVRMYRGEYAPFASMIRNSSLYVGYDSAGQHVAAATRTPLVSVFAGYAGERMFQRWRPTGQGRIEVVKVAPGEEPAAVLERTQAAVARITS